MWSRRLEETFAVITVGDEMIELLPSGPASACKVARLFTDNSNYMRLLGLAQIGSGVWLASGQYR